jgi:hypothetical protein
MIEDIPDPDEKRVHCFVVLENDLDVTDGDAAFNHRIPFGVAERVFAGPTAPR